MSQHDIPISDGDDKPLGFQTPDGELEVRGRDDGTIGYVETELGQHQRWLRQAPDLFERVTALTADLAEARARIAALEEDLERFKQKDRLKTNEINILTKENRQAEATIAAIRALKEQWQAQWEDPTRDEEFLDRPFDTTVRWLEQLDAVLQGIPPAETP